MLEHSTKMVDEEGRTISGDRPQGSLCPQIPNAESCEGGWGFSSNPGVLEQSDGDHPGSKLFA